MKCNKCNAEWKVDASRSASLTLCPFCQEKIEKASDWQYFDNTKELLAYVAAEYGNDALFGRKYFSDHSSPTMPQGQKNLVKQAFECGAVKILKDNENSDQAHRETAVKQAVGKIIDTYASAKEAAERVIWELTSAIGWGMEEPDLSTKDKQAGTGGGKPTPPPQLSPQPPVGKIAILMKRGWQSAEDSEWDKAYNFFDEVLNDHDPDYAPAFLGQLCADLKCSQEGKLAKLKDPNSITSHKYYKRAITDPAIKAQLGGYIQTINDRINAEIKAAAAEAERKRKVAEEAARKKLVQDTFDKAVKIMTAAKTPDEYRKAITAFGNIDSNYQDINGKIKGKITECEQKIIEWEQEKAAAEAEFQKKYDPLIDRFSKEGRAQTEQKRQKAQEWKAEGLCPHCGGTLKGLLGKKCVGCGKAPNEPEFLSDADVTFKGDIAFLKIGDISWRVLDVQNNKALLISEKILEERRYNVKYKSITWEECTLRKYLNGEFLSKLGAVQSAIAETRNENPSNPWYSTAGGNATTDKVFLLSLDEVVKYFGDSGDLKNRKDWKWENEKYVQAHGSGYYINDQYNSARIAEYKNGASWWWLRSPGYNTTLAARVDGDGTVPVYGYVVYFVYGGVRPALWLNL
ncbi:MAG: DUF6273 domain-containing protein [Lachnospiraceae bacterium]|nr:DUF6273 domain-containing protein [Lachnospiraceae bacterium]